MAGIADDNQGFDVFYGDNVDFTGGFPHRATMLSNGQLLIGSTALPHIQVGTLTSTGGTVSITYSNPNINLESITTFPWTDENSNFAIQSGNGYFISGVVTGTLPVSPSQGDTISFIILTSGDRFTIQANLGQYILGAGGISSSGGTYYSSTQGATITLVFNSATNIWAATSQIVNWGGS